MEGYSSSDDGSDFSNMSQAGSASEDEEDELPFGPARTKAEQDAPVKPTDARPSMEDGDIEMGKAPAMICTYLRVSPSRDKIETLRWVRFLLYCAYTCLVILCPV